MVEIAATLVFAGGMAWAAASDLTTMTISNRLQMVLVAAFALFAPFSAMTLGDIGLHVLVGAGVLALTFALFAAGWIGGGDAKLAAVIALWMGPQQSIAFAVYASVFGGVLTLAFLTFRRFPLPAFALGEEWLLRLHSPKSGIPYGVALAAGALMALPRMPWFSLA